MFGERIKTLRTAHGLNQVDLGRNLGVSKQTVSNWENDNILPSIELLKKIALYFGCSTDYLLELDDRSEIKVTALTDAQMAHVVQIVRDLEELNQK